MEEERKQREAEERAERDAEKRRRRRAKAGLDPDGLTEDDFKSKKESSHPPEEEEVEAAVVDAYQSSFRNESEFKMVAPESEAIDDFEYEHTLGAAIHNSDLRFEEMSEKLVQA